MANKLKFDQVKEGDEIPAFEVKNLSRTDIVKYAGASGDFNPIHHDQTFAESARYPTVFS
ncbi:MAG: MaoC/PaaZ C-terminal domain-containing protein, partial [Candidatus Binatia bacterium]